MQVQRLFWESVVEHQSVGSWLMGKHIAIFTQLYVAVEVILQIGTICLRHCPRVRYDVQKTIE